MEDQTNFLRTFGISAGPIGEDNALDLKIEKGKCSVVFSSPGSLLGNGQWRRRFPGKRGPLYEKCNCVNSFVFVFPYLVQQVCPVVVRRDSSQCLQNARTTTETPECLTAVYSTFEIVGGNPVRLVIMAPLSLLAKGTRGTLQAELFLTVHILCTEKRLCTNHAKFLLSMLSVLLRYSFEPRPYTYHGDTTGP